MLHQANAKTLTMCNFLKHAPRLIIFGTHNLQTLDIIHSSKNYY